MSHYFLTPRAPLHVGEFIGIEREAALEYIPSDTLFSAFVAAWAQQGVDITKRIAACQTAPPCLRLSSAFPRAQSVLFYPMPLGLKLNLGNTALDPKQFKRIRWVSQRIFEQLCQYKPLAHEFTPDHLIHHGSVWLSQAELQGLQNKIARRDDGQLRLWTYDPQEMIVPRVTIDRASQASNLFHSGRVTFSEGCGLWFASQTPANMPQADEWVKTALALLADSGLGGLRSTGHGAFSLEHTSQNLPITQYEYGITLSRFAPRNADEITSSLLAEHSAYRLVTVGGWCQDDVGKPWRRKRLRMLAEGACLKTGALGQIVDVGPDTVMTRPVYRYGLVLQVGVDPKAVYA